MRNTTQFVAACCRWPQNKDSADAVAKAAAAIEDWDEARQVVKRHRVTSLVHLAVKDLPDIPESFRAWAKQNAQATARHAMHLTQECIKIDRLFKDAGLRPLHFKGPVLAQIAYGSVALKFSHDLDIYIAKSDIAAAIKLLETAGYRVPGLRGKVSAALLETLMHQFKHIGFASPSGTTIELHWRFTNSKYILIGFDDDFQRQTIQVADVAALDTFDTVNMIEYLALHGALHHWSRLKWLADLAAFLEQLPYDYRDAAIRKVASGSVKDALTQALKLCDTLFDTQYAPDMSSRAEALFLFALNRIDQPSAPPRSVREGLVFVRDMIATRHLYSSRWAVVSGLKMHLTSMADVLAFPLPRYLNGLYPIIRLPSLLIRRLRG